MPEISQEEFKAMNAGGRPGHLRPKVPKAYFNAHALLWSQIEAWIPPDITYGKEHLFATPHGREFRADFAFVRGIEKLAVEIDGGTWNGGKHGRGSGIATDQEKTHYYAILRWYLIRVSPDDVKRGLAIQLIKRFWAIDGPIPRRPEPRKKAAKRFIRKHKETNRKPRPKGK